MVSNIVAKDISEVYRTPVLQQTAFWSKVKNRQGLSSIALNFKANKNHLVTNGTADDSYIESDLLILIKQIDSVHSIAYLPYG
ncbi:MAG: peptidoglycan bridge formation protein FemAB, partial [Bacteroidia bacterium]|nr:peptidoglycan bridge formation protein FemAB [Bacteroidia bacterium]